MNVVGLFLIWMSRKKEETESLLDFDLERDSVAITVFLVFFLVLSILFFAGMIWVIFFKI